MQKKNKTPPRGLLPASSPSISDWSLSCAFIDVLGLQPASRSRGAAECWTAAMQSLQGEGELKARRGVLDSGEGEGRESRLEAESKERHSKRAKTRDRVCVCVGSVCVADTCSLRRPLRFSRTRVSKGCQMKKAFRLIGGGIHFFPHSSRPLHALPHPSSLLQEVLGWPCSSSFFLMLRGDISIWYS